MKVKTPTEGTLSGNPVRLFSCKRLCSSMAEGRGLISSSLSLGRKLNTTGCNTDALPSPPTASLMILTAPAVVVSACVVEIPCILLDFLLLLLAAGELASVSSPNGAAG